MLSMIISARKENTVQKLLINDIFVAFFDLPFTDMFMFFLYRNTILRILIQLKSPNLNYLKIASMWSD